MCSASLLPCRAFSTRLRLRLLARVCVRTCAVLLTVAALALPALAQPTDPPFQNGSRSPHIDVLMPGFFGGTSASRETDNVVVDDKLRGTVEDLRRRSPEFRRQWALLSRSTRITVRLRLVARSPIKDSRAATTITSQPDGSLQADIAIPADARVPELLGHEFEHIVERLEGAKAQTLHELGDASVRRGAETFETARAVLVGRMVSAQFHSR